MRRIVALLVGGLLALVLTAGTTPALADANPTASCLGIGSSFDKAVRADDAQFVIEFTAEQGTSPGAFYRVSAQQHLGTNDACFG